MRIHVLKTCALVQAPHWKKSIEFLALICLRDSRHNQILQGRIAKQQKEKEN
jgi:hypothetical protein